MPIAIILAAGKGTRMRSHLPKPIVPFKGKPIVSHLIDAFMHAGVNDIYLIVGHGADEVREEVGEEVHYAFQKEQKGTAHAVLQMQSTEAWKDTNVFVFVGDSPLIQASTIKLLEKYHRDSNASCTFLTADFPIDLPYARVLKNEAGQLIGCVEEKNATVDQLEIRELLTSHFIFNGNDLFDNLSEIKADKDNQEYYLTDIIDVFLRKGMLVETLKIDSYKELVGLNTPEDIAWAEEALQTN
ncbi:NTP transferase domain-containing protein [Cytophaga aurantiaca]|uniref:NTP transferase domain-containing protein n=1 Tax=Cytophaga aurantiaca TaxID=29530 RepID=UPI000368F912|nr:NTP transferase domain-containing protein [Cytophaga aurantiaca]